MLARPASATSAILRPGSSRLSHVVGRYIVLSRLWLLALLALVVVPLWMGQYTMGLLGLAAGYAGFVFVFDSRRSWWGSEVRDFVAGQPKPAER